MSSELQLYQLDELCEFINGFAFKSSDYVEPSTETVEVLRMGYICRGGGFKEDNTPVFVPRKYGRNLDKYFLKPADVVIAMTDMKDKVAILANTAWISHTDRFVLNQRVGCIRVKRPDLLNPRFFYFYSNSLPHVTYLRTRANSGVQVNLSTSAIKESMIQVPPLADQLFIADLLGALDDRITLLRETNATLEAIAQALFKSWFVDFDPVRAKAAGLEPQTMDAPTAALFPDSFEESELGSVPKGWRVGKVEDVMDLPYGKALKSTDRVDGVVPVYGSGGITGYHNESLVDGPSIIVGRKGTVGSLYWEDRPFFPIDTVFYVKAKQPLTYCYYLLKTLGLEGMNTDGAVPGLNRNNAYRLQITVPSAPALQAFDEIVSVVREKIFANSQQAQTLTQLRDTLLPRLISGQLRLPEAEALLEGAL
jgi:type I restriction enzyme S subunit